MASLTPAPRSSGRSLDRPEPSRTWTERARDALDDIVDTTGTARRSLLAGCLLVGVALGGIYWLTRQPPVPVDAALPPIEPASVTTTTEATTSPAVAEEPVLVHVAGAVTAPGVYELPATAHVIDAVEAAGGLLDRADAARINLAAAIADGTQIYVPAVGETPPVPVGLVGSGGAGGDANAADTPIDLNRADAAVLESLPGVGPATAQAIIDHRERNGPFVTVDDLLEVRGIGEAKLAQLRDRVRT